MSIVTGVVNVTTNDMYTSSGNTAITFASFTNTDSANNIALDLHVVPSGDSASVNNQIAANIEVTAEDTYQIYSGAEKLLLENGDVLYALANANTVSCVISYTSV